MQHNEIIDGIRAAHRERVFAMETRKMLDLRLGSYLRMSLGWRKDLPDAERKAIADNAAELIKCGESVAKDKAHPLSGSAQFSKYADTILMSIAARASIDMNEAHALKTMVALAVQLPAWESFGKNVRGFGAASLAVIVGEAGDLGNYSTHSKLWKRMGLAVMDGVRQGGLAKGSSSEAWIAHGYNPLRRSRMWNIGDTMIKGNRDGVYRTLYLARKEYELAREPDMQPMKAHRRAQRVMEKRLLRNLWQAWRRAKSELHENATDDMPTAVNSVAPQGAELQANSRLPEKACENVPATL